MDIHVHMKQKPPTFMLTRVRNHEVCQDHDVLDIVTDQGEITLFLCAEGAEMLLTNLKVELARLNEKENREDD